MIWRSFFMSKYPYEFKIKIIEEYLQGAGGYPFLAKKYHLKDTKQLRLWVSNYKHFGKKSLLPKKSEVYSEQFKQNAVNLYLKNSCSYQELAIQLKLTNPALIATWVRLYREQGRTAFEPKPRGRPRKEDDLEILIPVVGTCDSQEEYIKNLEEKLLHAQVEIEYLKGLRRMRMERQVKINPNLFTSSNKNSSSH